MSVIKRGDSVTATGWPGVMQVKNVDGDEALLIKQDGKEISLPVGCLEKFYQQAGSSYPDQDWED